MGRCGMAGSLSALYDRLEFFDLFETTCQVVVRPVLPRGIGFLSRGLSGWSSLGCSGGSQIVAFRTQQASYHMVVALIGHVAAVLLDPAFLAFADD